MASSSTATNVTIGTNTPRKVEALTSKTNGKATVGSLEDRLYFTKQLVNRGEVSPRLTIHVLLTTPDARGDGRAPEGGLEPPRYCYRQPLKPVDLLCRCKLTRILRGAAAGGSENG